jgi:hypothetical protein
MIVSSHPGQNISIPVVNVITTFPDMTHSTSITDVMHIPDPKHGSGIRANLDTAHASVLRVCVAQARPPTWCVTLVPEASPVLGAKSDTQNGVNGRAPHSGEPSR